MAKYWEPGQVKTRLAADIGDSLAARLHRVLLEYVLRDLATMGGRRFLIISPDHACGDPSIQFSECWQTIPQGGGDLGERMQRFMQSQLMAPASNSLAQPATAAILIGADCPYLTRQSIHEAYKALEKTHVVIGPANDGGYYLIGMQGPWRSAFASLFTGMTWGSDRVADETRRVCESNHLSWSELKTLDDVDYLRDLQTLLRTAATLPLGDATLRDELAQIQHQMQAG